ncbi:MAG: glucosaminidase domain-containing protein [Bacillota bacterium]|nr:glucosaminidase domain-containing protein [Bacillota bacterium]
MAVLWSVTEPEPRRRRSLPILIALVALLLTVAAAVLIHFYRQSQIIPPLYSPDTVITRDRPILAPPSLTVEEAQRWAEARRADPLFIELAPMFWELATAEGVDPAIAYAQAALETDRLRFGGIIDASYHNVCGLKTAEGGDDRDPAAHQRFPDWETGIRAQIEHLALYAGAPGYPLEDPADPRHFAWLHGSGRTISELGRSWASAGHYGEALGRIVEEMLAGTRRDTR